MTNPQPKRPESTPEDIDRAIEKLDQQLARARVAARRFDEVLAEGRQALAELRAMRPELKP